MDWSHHQQDLASVFHPGLDKHCALMCSISACPSSPESREIVTSVLLPWSYNHPYLLPPRALKLMKKTVNTMPCFIYLKSRNTYVNKLLMWSEYIGKTKWQIWNKCRRLSLFPCSWFWGVKMSTQATPPPELRGANPNSPSSLSLFLLLLCYIQISVTIWITGSDLSHGTEMWDFFRTFLLCFATVNDLGDNQLYS